MIPFARITAQHDLLTFSVTPCARSFYNWLLRRCPAGVAQEIYLEEFQQWTGLGRMRQYCMRQIQNALRELTEIEVVQIVRRYTGRIFNVVARHPEAQPLEKNCQNLNKNSQNAPETPNATSIYREEVETTHTVVVEKPAEEEKTELNPGQEKLLDESKELGVKVSKTLIKEIRKTSDQVFRTAVNALKEAKEQQRVESPIRFLMAALKGRWSPSEGYLGKTSPEFNEWFALAKDLRLVVAAIVINGVQHVCTPDGAPIPWTEIATGKNSLEALRRRLEL